MSVHHLPKFVGRQESSVLLILVANRIGYLPRRKSSELLRSIQEIGGCCTV